MRLFFDLDGTLTDPRVGIVGSIRHALRELGAHEPEEGVLLDCIGPPLAQSFARLLGSEDRETVATAIRLYRERFSDRGMFENEVYPGIPAALAELRAEGRDLFVVTSKPWPYARSICSHFGLSEEFRYVYGSELDGTRVDKGELIAWALEREGLDPAGVWMIGDRAHDVAGARANGVGAIGVLWGYGSRAELQDAGADTVVADVGTLVENVRLLAPVAS